MREPTISVASLRGLLAVCGEVGIPRRDLLAVAGIAADLIEDPDARVPAHRALMVWEEAERRSSMPGLALRVAGALPMGAYRLADYLTAYSATVGEGLSRLARHFALVAEPLTILVDRLDGYHALRLGGLGSADPPSRFVELTLGTIVVRSRAAWALDWRPATVELRFAEPSHAPEHRRLFGCEIRYRCEEDRLLVADGTWGTVVPSADPALVAILEEHARLVLERLPPCGDLVSTVRQQIYQDLHGGSVSVGDVARALATSPRTLQRRLKEHDVTFASVLDEVRRETARRYLSSQDVSIAELGYLLGFSDQSAFQRAFKRWTGTTPRRFRRLADGAPARPTSAH